MFLKHCYLIVGKSETISLDNEKPTQHTVRACKALHAVGRPFSRQHMSHSFELPTALSNLKLPRLNSKSSIQLQDEFCFNLLKNFHECFLGLEIDILIFEVLEDILARTRGPEEH